MKSLLKAAAVLLMTTAAHATVYTVPSDATGGRLNMRSGPGTNHSLVGAIPAGATVNATQCVPRDDGIRGSEFCLVAYNGITGWAASSSLMPGYMPQGQAPVAVPPGTDIQSGEPARRPGQAVSPDYYGNSYAKLPPPRAQIDSGSFVCKPPLDRTDRDPVVKIWVSYTYDQTHRVMVGMNVQHERFSGAYVDRFQQYAAQLKFDGSIYGWTGALARNPSVHMAGGIYNATDGRWYYREKMWEGGRPTWDWVASCQPTEGE
jgi:hypothetical protein